ncbi:hypothetical protein K490DRAFT_71754 [Saccharata proteae CBS 121410]|uniref:Heme peroxidase n=1 Tax=Saccharata proteae CBS 121410 TaxID=1314787 RepID=A0A9P4M1N1_9PEZI|nr:hypothetical protein K490DRAFT_71754 [Saccharata proteae CBS 121410]
MSQLDKTRKEVSDAVSNFTTLFRQVKKPLPTETGDGTYVTDQEKSKIDEVEEGLKDLSDLNITDFETLKTALKQKIDGEPTDDRTYFMEHLIRTAAKLPDESKLSEDITSAFLTQLWNDLQHPPQSYLGSKYQYRQADGSYNSLVHPQLGAAGTPYARTVQPQTLQPTALPDAGVVFDSLMSRKIHEKHPNGISSMLFYLASIIIHDLFRTNHTDFRISDTSSYLDLSPLYGSNEAEQKNMREYEDGRIKPDCFSEERLLLFPPGVSCLLIMFNRFHNSVVKQLAEINEGGKFTKPVEGDKNPHAKTKEQYDEDLFQTGRLITCGLYVNMVLLDYVRTILNLNQTDRDWDLNPRMDIKGLEKGTGNQVSAEFNLIYRWHSTISDRDEKWTEELWQSIFPGKGPKDIGKVDLLKKFQEIGEKTSPDPIKRDYHGLKRDSKTGNLDEDAMAKILTESVEDCANSFGAQRVPAVMRVIEILGIEQARTWNVATLNELRKYFQLKPYSTFEEINPDKHVADQLRRLYDHPDLVEMYPGLVAEDAKEPMVPGSGLTPSYTVSRAVLSDAVALVRGDRFYTIDYHPKKLTNWGYSLVESDKAIDHGAVASKLFLTAFPNHFKQNSVYVHYPLTIPSKMKEALSDLGEAHMYDFEKPTPTGEPQIVFSYNTAEEILSDKETFRVTWGPAMEFLMGKPADNFMLAGDGYENLASRQLVEKAIYIDGWQKEVKEYYISMTERLLRERSYKLGDELNQVDIVRDVGNAIHVHFCADLFSLPLKTAQNPYGVFSEQELYMIMAGVFTVVFFDLDPASSFGLRQKAQKATQALGKLVELNVKQVHNGGILEAAMQLIYPDHSPLKLYGEHMIKRLLASGTSVHELVWAHIMGTAGGMVPNQGQLFAQCLEYFLTEGKAHLPEIQRLARLNDDASFKELMHYMMEGSRLGGETGVFRYASKDVEIEDSGRKLSFKRGDKLMISLRAASRDPIVFPDPDTVKVDRPIESYIHLGAGTHQCLGLPMVQTTLTAMLKVVVGKLDNLRVAQGKQGQISKIEMPLAPEDVEKKEWRYHKYLTETGNSFFPFPCALKVNWDGDMV